MHELEELTVQSLTRPQWLPSAEWPYQLFAIEAGGHPVHFVDVGEGPTLLFVHAGMWSFVWRDVIAELRRDFRCIALDFPGTGLSPAADGYETNLVNHSRVLESFIDELGLASLTLILHDLGGVAGLGLATRRPDLVRAIVATQAFGWVPEQRALRGMLALMGSRPMEALNVATNFVPRLTSTALGVGRRLSRQGRRAFLGPTRERARRRVFHRLMRDVRRAEALLESIELALSTTLADRPLLTIFGEGNDPFAFQQRWHSLFPSARQVVVPRSHHFPMNDDPPLFAQELHLWWQEEVGGGTG
jgi:pimeloyl-ACP methyl ester carboxylesterase